MVETSPRYCKKCKYAYKHNNSEVVCGYILETKKRRNCPVGMCDKFEAVRRKRVKKLTV